jgi:hypothetical protein
MLKHALKEWAAICQALAEGKQAILLRKGGIAEPENGFRVEHTRFWLLPTYVHQQNTGIKPQAVEMLRQVESTRPPQGTLRLTHFADVTGVYHLHDMVGALRVRDLHIWSDETIESRFNYRQPGLYLLAVRVFASAQAFEFPDLPEYAGCRSWVELERELRIDDATPVIDDLTYKRLQRKLEDLLNPTALA